MESLTALAAKIVAAYVANHKIAKADLPQLILDVQQALAALSPALEGAAHRATSRPAIAIGASITPAYIVCLEDGRKLKSLKRHLRARYDLSPEQYRAKWGLPGNYPMVAPDYSRKRSTLAKTLGFGRKRKSYLAPAGAGG